VAQRIAQEAGNIPSDVDLSDMNDLVDVDMASAVDLDIVE
jgi:hypothetical protein